MQVVSQELFRTEPILAASVGMAVLIPKLAIARLEILCRWTHLFLSGLYLGVYATAP